MRIGKKTIHDVTIGLAMALPILYLGGSMIAGLAGAHGLPIFANDETIIENERVDFNQKADFVGSSYWTVEGSPEVLTFVSSLTSNGTVPVFYPSIPNGHIVYAKMEIVSGSLSTPSTFFVLWSDISGNTFEGITLSNLYFYGSWIGDVNSSVGIRVYPDTNIGTSIKINMFDLTQMFGAGNEPSKEVFDNRFPSYYAPVDSYVEYYPVYGDGSYSEDIFNNFFPRNNFVERIGQNALSDNPKGFAPFGTMLSYLDENMFHAGDTQTALMVYGMVYWSLHVVLADLVYHVLVFVPNLINRVFDWFGQKGVSDD